MGFGKESLVVVHKGPRHDYLGISLDYSYLGKVIVDMKQYIDKVLLVTPLDIKGVAQTPTGEHLFKVISDCKLGPPFCYNVSSFGGPTSVLNQMHLS